MNRRHVLISVLAFSLVAGVLGIYVPWGSEDGLHGRGLPVPVVVWDKASLYSKGVTEETDHFIPFDNPLAVVENPLAILLLCSCVWGVVEVVLLLVRKRVRAAT